MKGMSVIVTLVLLLAAHVLASRMSRAGKLPAQDQHKPELQAKNVGGHQSSAAAYRL
jgi:hypothetical protein